MELTDLNHEYIVGITNGRKPDGFYRKDYKGFNMEWSLERATTYAERLTIEGENVLGVMRKIVMKNTGIVCIDIDEDRHYMDIINALPMLKGTLYVKGNTKGGHFYFKTDWKGKKDYIDCFDGIKGDLITNQMFELEGKEWTGSLKTISSFELQNMVKDALAIEFDDCTDTESCISESVPSITFSAVPYTSFEKSILNNISPEYYTSYDQWLKFLWAIKYSDFSDPLSIADEYSQKLPNYVSKEDVKKYMEQSKEKRIGWQYLMGLSKKSNLYNHKIILGERYLSIPVITEYHMAQIGLELIDDIIKKNNKFYIYKKGYWVQDTTLKECDVKVKLIDTLRKFWSDLQKNYTAHHNNEEEGVQRNIVKLSHAILDCCKCDKCANIAHMYKIYLPETEIEFDNKPYLFCFKNCAFDLQTGLPYTVVKEDYITEHTCHDYIPPTDGQLQLMNTLLNQIFPNPEIRDCYLSILFMGMTAIQVEKFFVANGKGRNGKGLLNELFLDLLGKHYGYILPISVLTSKMDISTGANPQIANCNKKRFILSREPEENAKIKTCIMKELTGCQVLNARQLHSSDCVVNLTQVQMLECNEKLQLAGTMNDSILDRIVDIPFVSHFTEVDVADTINHVYPINTSYKSFEWRINHRCALFHIILQGHRKLYIPKEIKEKSKEYVMSSDEIYSWIKENYDVGTEDDIIKTKDLYMVFCNSATYKQFSKEERRVMTKKKFTTMISSSISFRGQYRENRKEVNGVEYRERLHGWKEKEQMETIQEL